MPTQAMSISDLQAHVTALQLAYNSVLTANTQSGNLVTSSTVTAVQTAITTLQTAVSALTPVFQGNN